MTDHGALSKLLAALAIFGLLLGPLARPSIFMAGAGSLDLSRQTAMEMPAEMPCCPDQAPAKDCTKDCPFMLMCAGHYVSRAGTSGLVIPPIVSSTALPGNDAEAASLSHRPPPRPPKLPV